MAEQGGIKTFKDVHVEKIYLKCKKVDGKFVTDGSEVEVTADFFGNAAVSHAPSTASKNLELRLTTLENEIRLLKEAKTTPAVGVPGPAGAIGPMGPAGKDGVDGADGASGRDGKRFNVTIRDISGIKLPEKLVNGTKLVWNSEEEAFVPV